MLRANQDYLQLVTIQSCGLKVYQTFGWDIAQWILFLLNIYHFWKLLSTTFETLQTFSQLLSPLAPVMDIIFQTMKTGECFMEFQNETMTIQKQNYIWFLEEIDINWNENDFGNSGNNLSPAKLSDLDETCLLYSCS